MESPEGDRIKTTSSTPGSSPAVQESPFFNFISNLSPINSVKAARYTQGFSHTQFPTPPPVFRTPRLDLQRETSFLQSNEVDAVSTDIYGDCGNQPSTVLVPCIKKELLSCSPSGCVDDYLTDPVEAGGCTNSNDVFVQSAKNVSKLSRSGFTSPIITSTKANDANDRNSEDFMCILSDQAEVGPLRSLILFKNTTSNQRDAERLDGLLKLNPKERADQVESNGFLISSVQHHEQHVSQNAGIQQKGQDDSSQSPENLLNIEAGKNSSESLGPVSKGSVKESTLHQRGIRRHLLFEAALAGKGITTTKSHSSHDITQESHTSALPASLRDWENLIPSDVESREASSSKEATSSSHNAASRLSFCPPELVRSGQHDGSLPITSPFPSGFGLSSIAESVPMSADLIPSNILPSYMSPQQDKLIPEGRNHYEKDSNSCLISPVAGKIIAQMDNDLQDDQAIVGASSVTSQYTGSMKLLCDSLKVTLYEQQAATCEGMTLTTENNDRVQELNQASPKKKRKKATYNSESEGCKRCNCKRSRCLKLYCECFAAGVYCIDSCACECCFNKPEYEETVNDTRQQIESRNPLAFAPKIVNHVAASPANYVEVGNLTTPVSARHKRGCNCKKSKCLKKYCECFQANVGCSDGCRCEGCSNSYGKKTESKYQRFERWENQSHIKLDAAVTVTDSTKAGTVKQFSPRWEDLSDMSHLTPLSYSYPGAEASSASPSTREYQNVPRSQLHLQSNFKSSAVNPHWHSLVCFTPQSYENNAEDGLCSDGAVHDKTKEDYIPETRKDNSTLTNESKASLPNKKQVSQPQFQSQELSSSSSPGGLQSGRKFILQTMPSFPPLTPYSKSKDDIGQTESDFKGDPSGN